MPLAVLMSGIILLVTGLLRLGTFVKYILYPVTIGFTAGIAVIIFASQVKGSPRPAAYRRRAGTSAGKLPALVGPCPASTLGLCAHLLTVLLIDGGAGGRAGRLC